MFDLEPDAVDELKRRARRRLVGAIVLAVAAAVIVPAFLERESRPLGHDVQIQIPPMSKDGNGGGLIGRDEVPAPLPAAQPAATGAAGPSKANPSPDSGVPGVAAASPAQVPSGAPISAASQKAVEKPASTAAEPAPTAKSGAGASPAGVPSGGADRKAAGRNQGFVVQLAAYTEPSSARALVSELKTGGYPAYVEALATSHGALTRVRVGPYPTREAAEAVRVKLNAAGKHGLVQPSH